MMLIVLWANSSTQNQEVDWVLEDALEEELITLNLFEITTADDYKDALTFYKKGNYNKALAILENMLKLNLPDGRMDFITFMAGECYRKLNLTERAVNAYRYVIDRFPRSDKIPAAYFRVLQHAYNTRNGALADTIHTLYENVYRAHPLYPSVLYVIGKLYFKLERYGEGGVLLLKIPRSSARYYQGQYLAALSFLQLGKADKALLILDEIRLNATDEMMKQEVYTIMGDIYFVKKQYPTAVTFYRGVSKNSIRYSYAQVKLARIHLELKEYEKARDITRPFVNKGNSADRFFEMASILEKTYQEMGNKTKASQLRGMIKEQNINARLSFEVNEELIRIYEMIRQWRLLEYRVLEIGPKKLLKEAQKNIKDLESLKKKCRSVLYDIGAISQKDYQTGIRGLAEQRYIIMLRKGIARLEDSLLAIDTLPAPDTLISVVDTLHPGKRKEDSLAYLAYSAQQEQLQSIQDNLVSKKEEYTEIMSYYNQRGNQADRFNQEIQAKYLDLAFIRYLERKEDLDNMNKEMARYSRQKRDTSATDSTVKADTTIDVVPLFNEIDRRSLVSAIEEERARIIDHMEIFIDVNPGSNYIPQVLYRLAELHYDESSDDFNRRLEVYEKSIEEGDTTFMEFPEYELDESIRMYSVITENYGDHWLADDALFYKGLALKKLGLEEKALKEFSLLITNYPESEYFVEANMNVGQYYFSNPQIQEGKGYTLAEEAYRRVMQYPDHPQYVFAIYHLGWCYYMQDLYDDALAVFKYLVEKVDLDFDVLRAEEEEITNPLMREEAVDYIAISFDEQGGKIDEAMKFLSLVGNRDYAALVLKRMGKLREEDLDYTAAIKIYRRIVEKYGQSRIAPHASENLIKIFETNGNHNQAMQERIDFFKRYARGSKWHTSLQKSDPKSVAEIDSLAIATGLFVGDAYFRDAEKDGNQELYRKAAKHYDLLVKAYPDHPITAEALWNLAVILDTKLYKKKVAYAKFMQFSTLKSVESQRCEQAALNAIAIAQKMMPLDSTTLTKKLDVASTKVIEAAKNYLTLFPKGESFDDVVLNMGSVYYNRKMFANAIKAYEHIRKRGPTTPRYQDAGLLIAKCHFGMENWTKASAGFEVVWKEATDELQKSEAFKLLLQSRFLYAKQLASSKAYEEAALEYREIDRRYPGSEYGDITLFNSAEAFEKIEAWKKACKTYYELYDKYPQSKLAPDALFNAATNFEKIKKFDEAARMYELIVSNYPSSDKAKDALFNVGLSYEKMGKPEKMAEANERYTQLYPGEKDVEMMILRSAHYYSKASLCEKAIRVYKNYISRYPNSENSVEAYFQIGVCYLKEEDTVNALMSFDQAEAHNKRLLVSKRTANNYYAGEAAFKAGLLKQQAFSALSFNVTPEEAKSIQKEKTELLLQAVKVFKRTIEYKSTRMFEAAYRIGEMYEEFALSWEKQRLKGLDPVKAAVAQRDINLTCAQLMKKSFSPFTKVITLAKGLDSLSSEQQEWIDSAKVHLMDNYLQAGTFMTQAVSIMKKAPIPDKIREQPLFLIQYKKQLLETLEPLMTVARDYYLTSAKELKKLTLFPETEEECLNFFGRINFLIPNGFDKLAEEILIASENLPEDMDEDEREEYVFQFEDLTFELQDKSLFGYEDALELVKKEGLTQTKWHQSIMERLARLSPETYGKDYYLGHVSVSDDKWIYRTDSIPTWNAQEPDTAGWKSVQVVAKRTSPEFTIGKPMVIWGDPNASKLYMWTNIFLDGVPREASFYIACTGKYRVYVNEKLLLSDTTQKSKSKRIDSVSAIATLLTGGDNSLAIEIVDSHSTRHGVACALYALLDTAQSFITAVTLPKAARSSQKTTVDSSAIDSTSLETAVQVGDSIPSKKPLLTEAMVTDSITQFTSVVKAMENDIRNERLHVQKLLIKNDVLDKKIKEIQEELHIMRNRQKLQKNE